MTTIEKLRRLCRTANWQARHRFLCYARAWRYPDSEADNADRDAADAVRMSADPEGV